MVLQCLGYCLRKNRTLQSLRFDGQHATVIGYTAFRGCLYGNKKLVDVPYPYSDVSAYFLTQLVQQKDLSLKALSYKPKISAAYKRRDLVGMNRIIAEMVPYKVKAKETLRDIGKCAATLHDIFTSIEQNRVGGQALKSSKLAAKMSTTFVVGQKVKLVQREADLLDKFADDLITYYNSRKGRESAAYLSHSFSNEYSCCVVAVKMPLVWINMLASLIMPSHIFIPNNYVKLSSLVSCLFGGDPPEKFIKTLQKIHALLNTIGEKAVLWEQNLYEVAAEFPDLCPGVFDSYYVKVVGVIADRIIRQEGADVIYETQDQIMQMYPGVYDNILRTLIRLYAAKVQVVERESLEDGDGDGPNEKTLVLDPNDRCDTDNPLHFDGNEDGQDADGSDGGTPINDPPDYDGDVPIDLYAGAGPRDLPDADPDLDPASQSALSGAIVTSPLFTSHYGSWYTRGEQKTLQKIYFAKLLEQLTVEVPHTITPLEYPIIPRYAVVQGGGRRGGIYTPSVCTLTTQCSLNRLGQLEEQLAAWGGDASVAVYIPYSTGNYFHPNRCEADLFIERFKAENKFTGTLTISLLFGHENNNDLWDVTGEAIASHTSPLYPINNLRNLAVAASAPLSDYPGTMINSPLIFLVDVDFVPLPGLLPLLTESVVSRCVNGDCFIVPAFECPLDFNLELIWTDPSPKARLKETYEEGVISGFHTSHFPRGHSPTQFSR
jgi:hypothetical protein